MEPETLPYGDWLQLTSRLLWSHQPVFPAGDAQGTPAANAGAWLVRQGRAEIRGAYGRVVAGPGQWLVFPPGPRRQYFTPGTRLMSVAYEASWPDGSHWLDAGLPVVLKAGEHPELERRTTPIVRAVERLGVSQWDLREHPMRHGDAFRLAALLHRWLETLTFVLGRHGVQPARLRTMDERVRRALRMMDAAPLEAIPPVRVLAPAAGLSGVQLTRLFREHLHITPAAYAARRRLEHACRRLQMPDVRIREVAHELGFRDPAHFTRWFRAGQGMSPRAFRQGAKAGA